MRESRPSVQGTPIEPAKTNIASTRRLAAVEGAGEQAARSERVLGLAMANRTVAGQLRAERGSEFFWLVNGPTAGKAN